MVDMCRQVSLGRRQLCCLLPSLCGVDEFPYSRKPSSP
ncbi:hypothetical protein F441_03270 [Phytophthora nicotianae CJ01A1]|uniref:Uncharacterized protein n=1 Tax=Phytophthora nicotianae CJ01A1 TaxID=1317063 RepID=W2XMB0_PHYNI|nr:hypothetical protein F441_03270 [Phytophthora nicotianae CJ01A1]